MSKRQLKKQFFVVFSPTGKTPPTIIHGTHKGALFAAYEMARHNPGAEFFVMGSASRPCTVEPQPSAEPERADEPA